LDETIRVWDRQSWQCTAILAGHLHKLKKMLLTVDNQYLISYDKLGYLVAWKADWDKPL
jgi:WD40 repeat protein